LEREEVLLGNIFGVINVGAIIGELIEIGKVEPSFFLKVIPDFASGKRDKCAESGLGKV